METTSLAIRQFILAGKAFFTLQNKETGNRFTYKVSKLDDETKDMWFVSVLTGSDNDNSYTYAGIIANNRFKLTKKSKLTLEAVSVKGFNWLWNTVVGNNELPEKVEFLHAGKCGRCGRTLTTPESIESGFGPICSSKLGI